MKVLVVSGIWPPDVGGPAAHAPEVADFLHERGHDVDVVTTAWAPPAQRAYRVSAVPRTIPVGLRHYRGAALVRRRARDADVVYTTGMFGRSALGSRVARTPYVVKLTGDPAFERARWRGLVAGDVESFASRRGVRLAALRIARDGTLRGAAHIVCPSDYLRRIALTWGLPPGRLSVIPNATPSAPGLPERELLRREHGLEGHTLLFAGRLGPQKGLPTALEALARVDGVSLLVVGDGDERDALEQRARELGLDGRARFLGPLPRERVLELARAADAALLPSRWENFPHAVVEAFSVGTPVVATAVGGVPEVVVDDENGLLVPPADPAALAAAIRRLAGDPALRARLSRGAEATAASFRPEHVYGELERLLQRVAG